MEGGYLADAKNYSKHRLGYCRLHSRYIEDSYHITSVCLHEGQLRKSRAYSDFNAWPVCQDLKILCLVSQSAVSWRYYIFCSPLNSGGTRPSSCYITPWPHSVMSNFWEVDSRGNKATCPLSTPLCSASAPAESSEGLAWKRGCLLYFIVWMTQGFSRTGQTEKKKKSLLLFLGQRSPRTEGSLSSCFAEPLPFTSPALRNLINSDGDMKYSKEAPSDQCLNSLQGLNWGRATCWLHSSSTCPLFRSDPSVC